MSASSQAAGVITEPRAARNAAARPPRTLTEAFDQELAAAVEEEPEQPAAASQSEPRGAPEPGTEDQDGEPDDSTTPVAWLDQAGAPAPAPPLAIAAIGTTEASASAGQADAAKPPARTVKSRGKGGAKTLAGLVTAAALPQLGSAASAGSRLAPAATSPAAGRPAAVSAKAPQPLGEAPAPALDVKVQGPDAAGPRPGRAPAPQVPRFVDPRTLQLGEAARASVIRQIALRVGQAGGELRLQLDPPELGRVDLRMVERDGELSLHIVADRPDLGFLLERHAGELRHALAEQGVKVAHTSIESGDERRASGDRLDQQGQGHGQRRAASEQRWGDEPEARHRGWISAEGLDFWV